MSSVPYPIKNGFTISELMMAVAVLSLLLILAVPNFYELLERKRLNKATQTISRFLQIAHAESLKQQNQLTISIQSGSNWCIGLSDGVECDCGLSNACQLNGSETVLKSQEHPGNSLSISGFQAGAFGKYLAFEGIRGVSSASGSLTLTRSGHTVNLFLNRMGKIVLCSDTLKTYPKCS